MLSRRSKISITISAALLTIAVGWGVKQCGTSPEATPSSAAVMSDSNDIPAWDEYLQPDQIGSSWPTEAGYLADTPVLQTGGRSAINIENTSDEAVLVHLLHIDPKPNTVARQLYLPAHSAFVMENLAGGKYLIRYLNISTGSARDFKRVFEISPNRLHWLSIRIGQTETGTEPAESDQEQ